MPRNRRNSDHDRPFREQIEARMRELSFTRLEEFADFSGLGATTVYNLVHGRKSSTGELIKPSIDTLARLAIALETPLHDLLYQLVPAAIPRSEDETTVQHAIRLDVQMTGGPQMAGQRRTSVPVDLTVSQGKHLAAYRVQGTAMTAGDQPIHDNDIILIDQNDEGQDLSDVVIRLTNGSIACRTRKEQKSGTYFISRNLEAKDALPLVIPAQDVDVILGRVVQIVHQIEH